MPTLWLMQTALDVDAKTAVVETIEDLEVQHLCGHHDVERDAHWCVAVAVHCDVLAVDVTDRRHHGNERDFCTGSINVQNDAKCSFFY